MTIWQALTAKLGREPTATECAVECKRIIDEATTEAAAHGKLRWQRQRRRRRRASR